MGRSMAREEAIEELKILKEEYWNDDGYGHETKQYDDTMTALDMAIKALEQEPCEDCISRQAVIIALGEWIVSGEYQYTNATDYLVKRIKALPPVKLKSKIGHWIAVENEEMETMGYYCSECDLPMETENQTRFCPNCGAKMDEPQESEE